MHAPRVGFQYHRKSALATLPPGVKPWSQVLREHGYYATNNAKTDYNFKVDMKQDVAQAAKQGHAVFPHAIVRRLAREPAALSAETNGDTDQDIAR